MALFHVKECAECPLYLSCETGMLDVDKKQYVYCPVCSGLHAAATPEEKLGKRIEQEIPKWCPRVVKDFYISIHREVHSETLDYTYDEGLYFAPVKVAQCEYWEEKKRKRVKDNG